MKRRIILVAALLFVSAVIIAQKAVRTVYVTENGTKYHAAHCRTLKNHSAKEITEQEAINKKYTPCKICIDAVDADTKTPQKDAVTQKSGDGAPNKAAEANGEQTAQPKAAAVSSVKP